MMDYSVSAGVCMLRLAAPPLNMLTPELLDKLTAGVRRANDDGAVCGIVITGDTEQFSAGADARLFQTLAGPQEAIAISRRFQEAFQAVEDSAKPVVAAMAGHVLGGALELAAACHLRIAAANCRCAMPEVNLGIVPGAGGTQRLPRLVGPEAALPMLLRAETLSAPQALQLGLVDAVCPPEQLMDQARGLLDGAAARKTSQRTDRIADAAANQRALAAAAELAAAARPELIAPRKIVEVVRTGIEVSFAAGLAAEQQAVAECFQTTATRNKVYLFFATRATSSSFAEPKDAAFAERKATRTLPQTTAVVGMGTMGSGIAQALATAGFEVLATDQDAAALARGIERIRSSLERRVADGKLAPPAADATLARLHPASDWRDLAAADLVVESVFENLEVKRAVFARLVEVCRPDALLATNTSTLTLDALGAGLPEPQRLVGLHFFNPAHRMPLVEVIYGYRTPAEPIAVLLAVAKRLRKTPVVVRSRPGFLVNRLFVPYVQEAFWLLAEGAPAAAIDAALRGFGMPMGPLELIDMTGLDILVHAQDVLGRAFPDHGPLAPLAGRLVERGMTGQKSGAGVYCYAPGDRTPRPNPVLAELLGPAPRDAGPPHTAAEIAERLVLRMVVEAYRVTAEGVARSTADIDVATVLGIGFPDFRGGVLRYAADAGPPQVAARLAALAARCGPRFACPASTMND